MRGSSMSVARAPRLRPAGARPRLAVLSVLLLAAVPTAAAARRREADCEVLFLDERVRDGSLAPLALCTAGKCGADAHLAIHREFLPALAAVLEAAKQCNLEEVLVVNSWATEAANPDEEAPHSVNMLAGHGLQLAPVPRSAQPGPQLLQRAAAAALAGATRPAEVDCFFQRISQAAGVVSHGPEQPLHFDDGLFSRSRANFDRAVAAVQAAAQAFTASPAATFAKCSPAAPRLFSLLRGAAAQLAPAPALTAPPAAASPELATAPIASPPPELSAAAAPAPPSAPAEPPAQLDQHRFRGRAKAAAAQTSGAQATLAASAGAPPEFSPYSSMKLDRTRQMLLTPAGNVPQFPAASPLLAGLPPTPPPAPTSIGGMQSPLVVPPTPAFPAWASFAAPPLLPQFAQGPSLTV